MVQTAGKTRNAAIRRKAGVTKATARARPSPAASDAPEAALTFLLRGSPGGARGACPPWTSRLLDLVRGRLLQRLGHLRVDGESWAVPRDRQHLLGDQRQQRVLAEDLLVDVLP